MPSHFYKKKDLQFLGQKYGFYPQRSAGQNFLIDENVARKIVVSAHIQPSDAVLEVGAGFGSMTVLLAAAAKKVWAVELDTRLARALHDLAPLYPNVEVIAKDILKVDMASLVGDHSFKVVANIPYNITSILIKNLLKLEKKPQSLVLLLQKEVGERMKAQPGEMSIFAASVQIYSRIDILFSVSHTCFWPQPDVESVVVRLTPFSAEEMRSSLGALSPEDVLRVVKIGFSARRKMLKNNFQAGLHVDSVKIGEALHRSALLPSARAQELGIPEWIRLTHILFETGLLKK